MPLQIAPVPLAIVTLDYAGSAVKSARYFGNKSKVARVIDALHVGVAAGCRPGEVVNLLAANHHNPAAARAFFTGILSVQTPENASSEVLADIDNRIEQATRDLSAKLGVPTVGWIHHNTKTRHAHLLFPNSDGRRTIPLPGKFLKELQGFGWTVALVSGRGKGKRQALPVYPRARQLNVRDLAVLLVDQAGNLRDDRWETLAANGKVGALRFRKDGTPISLEFGGRRIRFSTLKGFVSEQEQIVQHMIEKLGLNQPVPKALLDQLAAVGLGADAVNRVVDEFRDVKRAAELDRKSHIVPQPPKMNIQ